MENKILQKNFKRRLTYLKTSGVTSAKYVSISTFKPAQDDSRPAYALVKASSCSESRSLISVGSSN